MHLFVELCKLVCWATSQQLADKLTTTYKDKSENLSKNDFERTHETFLNMCKCMCPVCGVKSPLMFFVEETTIKINYRRKCKLEGFRRTIWSGSRKKIGIQ